MKRQALTATTMLGLLLTLAVASVNAQSTRTIQATIPFDFTAGGSNLQAGEYSVRFTSANALLLRSADGKTRVIIRAQRAVAGDSAKPERLVFNRYGDQYFLAQIWMTKAGSGRELDPTSVERRVAKESQLAKSNSKREVVEIATSVR